MLRGGSCTFIAQDIPLPYLVTCKWTVMGTHANPLPMATDSVGLMKGPALPFFILQITGENQCAPLMLREVILGSYLYTILNIHHLQVETKLKIKIELATE